MSESVPGGTASEQLSHDKVRQLLERFGEAGIVNLDTSVRDLMSPVAEVLGPDLAQRISLHVVCCNEHVLVTE